MRRVCRSLIASLLLFQACHATSIVSVVSHTGEYVVLAADSRDFHPKVLGKSNNCGCKVIVLGDTLFFNTGNTRIKVSRGEPWSSQRAAQDIYTATKDHDAQALSIAWSNRAVKWFEGLSTSDIQSVTDSDGGVVTGGFINFDQHRNPVVFTQDLDFNLTTGQLSALPEKSPTLGGVAIYGIQQELAQEFINAETPRAIKAYGTLKVHNYGQDLSYDIVFVQKAVQFVIDNASGKYKELVHGPIDVVVLQRFGGIRWVTRKPICYSEDLQASKKLPKK
jgi:hypothetical protein